MSKSFARGDVTLAVSLDNIAVTMVAENASWSPDVVDDIKNRVLDTFKAILEEVYSYGLINTLPDIQVEETVEAGDSDG